MSYGKPEIPATRYNKHLPAEPAEPTRMERVVDRAKHLWENRPSMLELQWELGWRLAMGSAVVALAVGVADDSLDLHLADRMSHVKVDPTSNVIVQEVQQFVHEVGVQARQAEK